MKKLIWLLAAGLLVALSAETASAVPSSALTSATRAVANEGTVVPVGHRRHWRHFHAPYHGIYVAPRYHYRHYYRPYVYPRVYRYDVPRFAYYYAAPAYYYAAPRRYYYSRRYHYDYDDDDWDDDWDDDDWDD